VSITKQLLKHSGLIDFNLKNSLGHNCLDAHADFTSYDESAMLIEKAMASKTVGSDHSKVRKSSTLFLDKPDGDIEVLINS
jgi:hypothetical protein